MAPRRDPSALSAVFAKHPGDGALRYKARDNEWGQPLKRDGKRLRAMGGLQMIADGANKERPQAQP
jgi:hypothetical protein